MLNYFSFYGISLSLVTLFLLPPMSVVSVASEASLKRQRAIFLQVEQALRTGNYKPYWRNRWALKGYPLAPYLDYLGLSGELSNLTQSEVDRFTNQHPNLPQSRQLKKQWLRYLSDQQQWQQYLVAYHKNDGGRYQCLKGIALYHTGDKTSAWQEAKTLWLQGESQHKACDQLFANWKAAGELTQSLIIARFWMAAEKHNLNFARYLDKFITDAAFKASTRQFWAVHKKPELLNSLHFNGQLEHERIIMVHGIKRLMAKNLDLAVNTWLRLRDQLSYPQRASIDKRIALKAAKNFVANASDIADRIDPGFNYPSVTEWRIRAALAAQDWQRVNELIARLPKSLQGKSRWRYWDEVAILKQKKARLERTALTPVFEKLSQERNFYAFLVADLKGLPFQLNHQRPTVRSGDLQQLQQSYPGFKRIREWVHHQRFYQAQQEINRITPSLNDHQKKRLPYLAQQWQWHHQAIIGAARAALWNDVDLRFPVPDAELFNRHAQSSKLDPFWLLAIARQESAFHPQARSHAGALGLMQLMPTTAKQAAKKAGIPYRRREELFSPTTNIALGSAHLSWLAKRFAGSRVMASAAYNAGSTPVKRWLQQRGHLPLDIWIETIPYDETRNYVQNVMAFRVIYSLLENRPTRMFSPQEVASLSLNQSSTAVMAQRM